jgi:SAM-dependent methyltransferase
MMDSAARLLEMLIDAVCANATKLQLDGSYYNEIGQLVNQENFDASSAEDLLANAFTPARARLLDFGCGAMGHRGFIESIGYTWHGVDYLAGVSSLVRETVAQNAGEVSFYDGITLPYADAQFDMVWAMLVLQHVQHIDKTFAELARVLKPGGKLIGQVSYLEQVQDYGTFNYTPIGLKIAASRNGLALTKIYPKHDAFSFLTRRLAITLGASDDTPFDEMLDPDGYFHGKIIETGTRLGLGVAEINLLRLQFCTHFVFAIEKPPG